ncbi:MAG: response regulator [Betaproteobacteria bacterium]|nr:response regulator [Betaproteobacteria bacterium]
MKIVIVDDDEAMRNLLRAICEGEGHQVVAQYADGSSLLDFVRNEHPDVVCLDYELPGKNGFELLAEIDVAANDVAVVMISGSSEPELKGHAADLGASGFIQKPFEEAQIIDELNQIERTRAIAARAAASPTEAVSLAAGIPTAHERALPEPVASNPQETAVVVPRTAVIIDDSGAIRLLLKGVLQEIGIKVMGLASNAEEGIVAVRRFRPAVICLDVNMPGMSGLDALPHIKAVSPQTKIVIVTGNASRQIVQAAIGGGAIGYFLKPIRPAKVEEFMQKLLQR